MQFIVRDGVRLAYAEAGQNAGGKAPVLLVHGMQCNHAHMLAQLEHFSQDRRVVAVDLRGHGQSDAPPSLYTNQEFIDDLIFLCGALGLERPIAMGHSFGGSTLLHLAAEHPDFLSAIVLFDSGLRSLANKVGELKSVVHAMNPAESRAFLAGRLFGRDDPPALTERILDEMFGVSAHVIARMGETVLSFDSAAAAEKCRIPALFLLADKPFTDAATLVRLGPNWRLGQVVGAGHFIQMIVPEQVNAMIDRFLAVAGL